MAQKVVVDLPEVQTPVLPPVRELLIWFDLPATLSEAAREIAKREGVEPPADTKTIKKMTASPGISIGAAFRIESFFARYNPDAEAITNTLVEKNLYKYSNGCLWELQMLSLAKSKLLRPGHALSFVRRRITSEQYLIKSVREAVGLGGAHDDIACAISAALDYECDIPASVVEEGIQEWAALLSGEKKQSHSALMRWLHHARVDFYYRLLCEFSLDLLVVMKDAPNFSEIKARMVEDGAFSHIAPLGCDATEWYPFGMLLDRWHVELAPSRGPSWRDFASYMPSPRAGGSREEVALNEEDVAAAHFETKLRRLHEWRGGTVPQPNQLRAFVTSLVPEGYDVELSLLIARIALAWGAFLKHEEKFASAHAALSVDDLKQLFASFGGYWAKYRDQAAKLAD